MLDPRRLLTFRAVARAGSFSRAARELALTQPAVSQQVAALERELGARLLMRGSGGLSLTAAGRLALDHADAVADRLALADRQLAEARDDAGPLRVGAFPSALATVVPEAIVRLAPQRVEALEGTLAELAHWVGDGTLHVAVCFQDAAAQPREHAGLTRHELGRERFVAAVGEGHRLAGRRTVRLRELAGDTWTAPSRTGMVRQACVNAGFEPDIAIVASDVLAIRALIAAGLAVTLTPALAAPHAPGVRVLEVREGAPERALYALTPRTGTSPAARAFVDALRALLSPPRPSRGSRRAPAPRR
jgi:DNA-binding transcriptional LysR family regulator